MIKFKHILLSTLAATAMINASAADETMTVNGGSIHFNGSIVATPCVVEQEDQNKQVALGDFQTSKFTEVGSTSAPVQFDINLISCDVETYKNVALTFKGITLPGNASVLAPAAIEASDTVAEGVGIQILQDSNIVTVDGSEATAPFSLLEGKNKLSFQAQYVSTAEEVSAGSASATVDFLMTYN